MAFPGVDIDNAKVIEVKRGDAENIKMFVWQNTYEKDHATYVHYARVRFYYSDGILFVVRYSLKTGRELAQFEIAPFKLM